jgi:protein-S-isoprenylcysteine O-methyltransferase Ste14
LIAYFFSKFAAFKLHGIDLVGAGVLSALCFAFAYLRATDILTKERWALIWREIFLVSFAAGNLYLAWTDWKSWGYIVITVLCGASAVLLWRSSPRAKYPLFAVTLFLGGNALIFGIYNYIRQPELLHSSLESQIIGWLIPGVPTALLVSCCLYARQVGLHRRTK